MSEFTAHDQMPPAAVHFVSLSIHHLCHCLIVCANVLSNAILTVFWVRKRRHAKRHGTAKAKRRERRDADANADAEGGTAKLCVTRGPKKKTTTKALQGGAVKVVPHQ